MIKYPYAFCPELNRLVTLHEVRELTFGDHPVGKPFTESFPSEDAEMPSRIRGLITAYLERRAA